MFSAADGLYLAVFMAVVFFISLFAHFICKRYCGRCSEKNRSAGSSASRSFDGSINTSSTCSPTAPTHTVSVQPVPGRPRTPRLPRDPIMQTVLEEDEASHDSSGEDQENAGIVYTIYTFPQNSSNGLSVPTATLSKPSSNVRLPDDKPPSYEDLFPVKSESRLHRPKSNQQRPRINNDVALDMEPKVHSTNSR